MICDVCYCQLSCKEYKQNTRSLNEDDIMAVVSPYREEHDVIIIIIGMKIMMGKCIAMETKCDITDLNHTHILLGYDK